MAGIRLFPFLYWVSPHLKTIMREWKQLRAGIEIKNCMDWVSHDGALRNEYTKAPFKLFFTKRERELNWRKFSRVLKEGAYLVRDSKEIQFIKISSTLRDHEIFDGALTWLPLLVSFIEEDTIVLLVTIFRWRWKGTALKKVTKSSK